MNKKGFTLIELIIVLAIVGILGAVLVPKFVTLINEPDQEESKIESPKVDFKSKVESKTVSVPTQQIIECVEGKQTIKIQGEVFYLGRIKNTWGDLEPIHCE